MGRVPDEHFRGWVGRAGEHGMGGAGGSEGGSTTDECRIKQTKALGEERARLKMSPQQIITNEEDYAKEVQRD
jgi:hypothetical protein